MPLRIDYSDQHGVRVQQANVEGDESAEQVTNTSTLDANLLEVTASQDEVQEQAAN